MEKKNFKKVSNKRQSKQTLNLDDKKFSKAKFRKEVRDSDSVKELKNENQTRSKKNKSNYRIPTKYEFIGKPIRKFFAIITQATKQSKGYSVIPKGQCVMVEDFGANSPFYRVTAQDERIGIIAKLYLKNIAYCIKQCR